MYNRPKCFGYIIIHDCFTVILCISWRVPHVGQEMLTLSGMPDLTKSLYTCIYITEFASQDYVYGLIIVWLDCLTAMSRTYFGLIIFIHLTNKPSNLFYCTDEVIFQCCLGSSNKVYANIKLNIYMWKDFVKFSMHLSILGQCSD